MEAELRLKKADTKDALTYFYCDRNRADHGDPASILRSLIRQLSTDKDDTEVCHAVEEQWRLERRKGFPSKELTFDTCKKVFPRLVAAHTKTIIVIDGLDECGKETRFELMRILDDIIKDPSCFVKIFIASRDDQDLVQNYIGRTHLQVRADDNGDDIQSYVLQRLADSPNSWFREKISPGLKDTILDTFSKKSEGM